MPKTIYASSNNTRTTQDLKIPIKNNGTTDKRYSTPQYTNPTTGKRDMRTTLTSKRK